MQHGNLIGLIAFSASLASCTLFKTSCQKNGMERITEKDSLAIIYNDSIDTIILCADKVRLYDMADLVALPDSTTHCKSNLFNYVVKKDMGLLKKNAKNVLHFIISDSRWYIKDYTPIRQPFHPNIGMEFMRKSMKAYMFVSFGTEEIAIATSNGDFKFYLMRDKRQISRWVAKLFPNEEYYTNLLK